MCIRAHQPLLCFFFAAAFAFAQPARWSQEQAERWYARQPWLVGADFIPSTAINQLEMWQADTFDPETIDRELGWAQNIGMNTMRVFLHDLLWKQDADGFKQRIDRFLQIADRHHMLILFVLFDSCWDPDPQLGKQREPRKGVHNSGWMQSPGREALMDRREYPRLEAYVKGVIGAFANDPRVLAWDLWNEPDNENRPAYIKLEPHRKTGAVVYLLPQVFEWARQAHPTQPLTSGVWTGRWTPGKLSRMAKIQLENSDIVSFHNYGPPDSFRTRAVTLEAYHRPLFCTEYMARDLNSTFQNILPIARKLHIAAYNWGLVAGKTQTWLPWDSWKKPYVDHDPPVWHHDVFYKDGRPYRQEEVDFIRKITSSSLSTAQ
ncbi:MAG TPA: cellulase family glycosylhydrolase [Bryobacteraceae bacterium]|nr:cellulase family glycosylhydrolase [Bryobacteraceae bacterium]